MPVWEFAEVPRISVLSTTYVRATVSATEFGLLVNPTSGTVSFAFLSNDSSPASGDWKTGGWEATGDSYYGRCLVGTGGTVTLAAGTYNVWIRVVKGLETVIQSVGNLAVY